MNTWNLRVKDFGRIKEANVEVSPFMLFIGDNNSGKSYLMTLIYGLLNSLTDDSLLLTDETNIAESYGICEQVVLPLISMSDNADSEISHELSMREFQAFNDVLNEILRQKRKMFLKGSFNRDTDIGEIEITVPFYNFMLSAEHMSADSPFSSAEDINKLKLSIIKNHASTILFRVMSLQQKSKLDDETKGKIKTLISKIAKTMIIVITLPRMSSLYLPISRTGFMLTYKALADNSFQTAFSENEEPIAKTTLTKPCVDFLRKLTDVIDGGSNTQAGSTPPYSEIYTFIKEKLIGGDIIANSAPIPDIFYKPSHSESSLPLYASSGVVTEISPLLLFLENRFWPTIMMEEPESGLHLELQQQIARVLIRLLNAGTNIIATTHSDTITQHVKNMMRLFNHPDKEILCEKYGYSKSDLLDHSQVRVYQFEVEGGHSIIKPLICNEQGFDVPTFNKLLIKMYDESIKFSNEVE
jgi:predicted ATP-dependent endonuclease of OLD family